MKSKLSPWGNLRAMTEGQRSQPRKSFRDFDDQSLWPESDAAPLQVCPPKTELFRQGSPAKTAFFVETGLVKLIRVESDGREVIADLRYPSSVLGAAEIIVQQPHTLTAITVTKCRLKRFSAESFLNQLKTDTHISWSIHQSHGEELRHQRARMIELSCLSARHRLERLLLQLLSASESNPALRQIQFHLPLKDWEVAELIAVTPSYLSRLLNELEKEGLIKKKGRSLTIMEPLSLRHWADDFL